MRWLRGRLVAWWAGWLWVVPVDTYGWQAVEQLGVRVEVNRRGHHVPAHPKPPSEPPLKLVRPGQRDGMFRPSACAVLCWHAYLLWWQWR